MIVLVYFFIHHIFHSTHPAILEDRGEYPQAILRSNYIRSLNLIRLSRGMMSHR